MQAATRSRLTLACILVTILLDMIGVGIIVPVLPELLEDLTGGSSVANAAVILSLIHISEPTRRS
jgi:DHA1 family tetracycline resistance protein-like MFS transporter